MLAACQSICAGLLAFLALCHAAECERASDDASCQSNPSLHLLQRTAHKQRGSLDSGAEAHVGEGVEAAGDTNHNPLNGWLDWFKPLEVSTLFYRPRFECGSPYASQNGNASHVREWMEQVMTGTTNSEGKQLRPPDFIGFSQMENMNGIPGGNLTGFGAYSVLGSVCKGYTPSTKYLDPIGLYYNSLDWSIVESYPPNIQKCSRYPPPPYNYTPEEPFDCKPGQVSPGADSCCACTNGPNTENATFYGGSIDGTYFNYQGTRSFVLGKFQHKASQRKVCVATFNLPHQMLAACSSTPTAACFGNAALNAYRIGTEQMVKAINEVCENTPLMFTGDTNNAGGMYATSFLFYNPYNPNVAKNVKACAQPAPVTALHDPPSSLGIRGSPYTCCNDAEGVNLYASDRVSASGQSASSVGGFFTPKVLYGGARNPGEAVADPGSVGVGSSCPDVNASYVGLPCCGSGAEHAPVWGIFDLYGGWSIS